MYDEFVWIKVGFVMMLLFGSFIYIEGQLGNINIEFTGSDKINSLLVTLYDCQNELDAKCDPCPIVKCAGDMTFFGFLIGLFFGFVGGVWFTLNFGKKFAEVFKKEIEKVKK